MMLYFLLKPENIPKEHSVSGCNYYTEDEKAPTHFSGNFWWAKTSYLKDLPQIIGYNKMDAEFWLFKNNPTYKDLHSSGLNHYYQKYPESEYSHEYSGIPGIPGIPVVFSKLLYLKYRY